MNLNKVILFGNLTRDPEVKSLPSGMQVATFGLATNRIFRDRTGNKQEQADFHNIVVFGRQAETVSQYLKKGSSAFVEGRIQTRTWEKDGEKRSRTEIVAERVQFGPRSGGSGGGSTYTSAPAKREGRGRVKAKGPDEETPSNSAGIEYPAEEINPEDIPF